MLKIEISSNKNNATLKKRVVFVLNIVAKELGIANGALEVSLVGDDIIKTNVKSYPAPADFPHPESKARYLGEVYLNPGYIKEKGEDFDYMLIHGFLHLLGYDHKENSDAEKMEKLEKDLIDQIKKNA